MNFRRTSSKQRRGLRKIRLDKESLYDNAIQLKKSVNALKKENEKIKSKLIQEKGQGLKKDKLLQDLVSQLNVSTGVGMVPSSYKEASLTVTLKKMIRRAEIEIAALKEENTRLKKNIRSTKQNELESMNTMLSKECRRLRTMVEMIIKDKNPTGYTKLETKLLEQKSITKELKEFNEKLRYEAEKAKESEKLALDQLKEYEERESKKQRQKGKQIIKKPDFKEAKDEIAKLMSEKRELEERLKSMQNVKVEVKQDTISMDELEKEKENNAKLMKKFNTIKKTVDQYKNSILEKDKEIREVKAQAKEKEEAYILKGLEDKERMTQRIVRLELELSAKNKEMAQSDDQPKVMVEMPRSISAVREITKPLINPLDLENVKDNFKLWLIKSKVRPNDMKEILFSDYKPDERISIKELSKLFQRKPLGLPLSSAEALGRFLIEARNSPEVVYNQYNDKLTADIRIKLDTFLGIDYPNDFCDNLDKITESAFEKLQSKFRYLKSDVKDVVSEIGELDSVKWTEICKNRYPELKPIEKDYLMSLMVGEDCDLKDLHFSVY